MFTSRESCTHRKKADSGFHYLLFSAKTAKYFCNKNVMANSKPQSKTKQVDLIKVWVFTHTNVWATFQNLFVNTRFTKRCCNILNNTFYCLQNQVFNKSCNCLKKITKLAKGGNPNKKSPEVWPMAAAKSKKSTNWQESCFCIPNCSSKVGEWVATLRCLEDTCIRLLWNTINFK